MLTAVAGKLPKSVSGTSKKGPPPSPEGKLGALNRAGPMATVMEETSPCA